MPGLDGMGVIRKLRDKNIPLPYFVMATAFTTNMRPGGVSAGRRSITC
jgi:CheY-like chemotaxis protein